MEAEEEEEEEEDGGDTPSLYVALLTSCLPLLLFPFSVVVLSPSLTLPSRSLHSLPCLPFHPSLLFSVSLSIPLFLVDLHSLPGDFAESRQGSVSGVFVRVYVCVCARLYCACVCVCVCLCMHACMCVL